MTLPDVGLHDREIYAESSNESLVNGPLTGEKSGNKARPLYSQNFSKLPFDEFETSQTSMSSIHSNDSIAGGRRVSMQINVVLSNYILNIHVPIEILFDKVHRNNIFL